MKKSFQEEISKLNLCSTVNKEVLQTKKSMYSIITIILCQVILTPVSHVEIGKYQCPLCKKDPFTNEKRLRRHHQRSHNDKPKDKICSICSKGFRTVKTLNRHLESHTGGPFTCKYCGEQFKLKTECYYHERRGKVKVITDQFQT